MIEIKIDNDYRITSDERNFILQHRRVITGENAVGKQVNPENIGKEVWEDDGFHRTIKYLLDDYTRKKVLKSKAASFEELYAIFADIKQILLRIADIDNLLGKSIVDISGVAEVVTDVSDKRVRVKKEVKKVTKKKK